MMPPSLQSFSDIRAAGITVSKKCSGRTSFPGLIVGALIEQRQQRRLQPAAKPFQYVRWSLQLLAQRKISSWGMLINVMRRLAIKTKRLCAY